MKERGQEVLWFAPLAILAILIGTGLLIAGGPGIGGAPAEVHAALRELLVGDERPLADRLAPAPLTGPVAATSIPLPTTVPTTVPTIPLMVIVPTTQTLPSRAACAAFWFSGAANMQEGRVSFGRFNLVTDTDPYGKGDPLASWKLVRFASFPLGSPAGNAGSPIQASAVLTIPVDQSVNMAITDPFTEEILFSARWQVEQIEVVGNSASINARLGTNLSDIRVNTRSESETLAAYAKVATGVLVMRLESTEDIASALEQGQPLYVSMSGFVNMDRCLR
jgi:hypothetical protein